MGLRRLQRTDVHFQSGVNARPSNRSSLFCRDPQVSNPIHILGVLAFKVHYVKAWGWLSFHSIWWSDGRETDVRQEREEERQPAQEGQEITNDQEPMEAPSDSRNASSSGAFALTARLHPNVA